MELSDISVSEHKHEEEAVVIKTKSAENEVKDHSYVNTTLVVGTDMNVQGKRETHIYEHLQTKKHNTSNCKGGCMTIFKQYKYCIMLSLNGVLLTAVTVLAIFIGLPEKTVINGGWALWGSWSQCSATCDTGATYRERACSDPVPARGGMFCAGSPNEFRLCNQGFCPAVDGGWSNWSTWGICSATCGTGLQRRNRTCSDSAPETRGRSCVGDFSEYQQCSIKTCVVVNGGWSIWEPWGLCSATCGSGMNRRVRSCSNPTPSNGGNFCFGESSEYRLCNIANCRVIHGGWSLWTSWTSCSSSCMKTRTRSCTNPAPSQDGHMCQGDAEDKDTCNLHTCAFRLYVRLAGGSLSSIGRVEVSLDNFDWGSVCDDNFDQSDAQVVCRMLGYTGTSTVLAYGTIGGRGLIYLDDLACSGLESSLLYCQHRGWGNHNCGTGEAVGVSCS